MESTELDLQEVSQVSEIQTLLEALSLELMKSNIEEQIRYETSSTTDFLSTIISKFRLILDMDNLDELDKTEVKFQMMDFCDELTNQIADRYDLYINDIFDDFDNKIKLLETLYNFFIINRCRNVERVMIGYIRDHMTALMDTLEFDDKAKDITSLSNKKKNLPRENVCVLSHIVELIDFIRSGVVSEDEFLQIINDGEIYTTRFYEYYTEGTIGGAFASVILNEVFDDLYDNPDVARIRNNIRIAFY